MAGPRRVIIDTDPGIDDAAALFFALGSSALDVEALTTTYGNVEVEKCTRNALKLLEVAGHAEVPVFEGASRPLMRPPRYAKFIHGEDGLGDVGFEEPAGRASPGHAAQEIVRRAMDAPGEITLLALGPLTNLALAVSLEPRVSGALRQVVYMGGAVFVMGNASPVASANNLNDPEAAAIVYRAGFNLVQVGLDVCEKCYVTHEELDAIRRQGSPVNRFFGDMAQAHANREEQRYEAAIGFTQYGAGPWVHFNDVPTIAYAIDPHLFESRDAYVEIETRGEHTAGQTVVDLRGQLNRDPNVAVCLRVDGREVARRFLSTFD